MRYMEKTPLTSLSSLEVFAGLILGRLLQVATSLARRPYRARAFKRRRCVVMGWRWDMRGMRLEAR